MKKVILILIGALALYFMWINQYPVDIIYSKLNPPEPQPEWVRPSDLPEVVSAVVVDAEGNEVVIDNAQAESYMIQPDETLYIEYGDGSSAVLPGQDGQYCVEEIYKTPEDLGYYPGLNLEGAELPDWMEAYVYIEPGTENDNPPPPEEVVNAYVIDENGEKKQIPNEEAESYVPQEGERIYIEYDNGTAVEIY